MQLDQSSPASTSRPFRKKRTHLKNFLKVVSILAGLALLCLCRYQLLWTDGGPMFLAKDRFTLSESFVSLEWINDAGTVAAKEKWPITFAALNREGIMRLRPATIVRFKSKSGPGRSKG